MHLHRVWRLEKSATVCSTITLTFLGRFFKFLYRWRHKWILYNNLMAWWRHNCEITSWKFYFIHDGPQKCVTLFLTTTMAILIDFYSAAALLAMQRAVIATAIPSVRLSILSSVCHTLVLYPVFIRSSRWGSKNTSFLIPTMVGGDVPFYLKFALKVTHPLWKTQTSTNICL